MKNKKVIITIGRLNRGGAEMRILHLIEAIFLLTKSIDITVYIVSGKFGDLDERFKSVGARLEYGKTGISGLFLLLKLILRENPDVLHINASLAAGIYNFIGWLCRVPIRISHIRTTEDYDNSLIYRLKKPIYILLLNTFSTLVIGVCNGARNLSKTSFEKWLTVYNGIELPTHIKSRKKNGSLICLGRMHNAKNFGFAIEVLNSLVKKYPNIDWKLNFYGREDKIIKDLLIKLTIKYNLNKKVIFHGISSEPLNCITESEMLLLPSNREGLPGVVLEAATVGVPSICSPLPGCVEISEQLDMVNICSLEYPDRWADLIYDMHFQELNNKSILNQLINSDFNFKVHQNTILKIWGVKS